MVSFCRWAPVLCLAASSIATTHNLKSTPQNPSETDGPEDPAGKDLAAMKSGNRPGHCRINEGRKLGILHPQRACFHYDLESFVESNLKTHELSPEMLKIIIFTD